MAKSLSRFFVRKQDEKKEIATLFFRVQNKKHKVDMLFSLQIRVNVAEWKEALSCPKTGCATRGRISICMMHLIALSLW